VLTRQTEFEEAGVYDLDGVFVRLGWAIKQVAAKRVVLDTVEALFGLFSNERILRSEIRRLFAWLKDQGVTAIVTGERGEGMLTRFGLEEYVSDCVILLDQRVERQTTTRRMRVVKYRGSAHGGDEYPFIVTEHGLSVLPVSSIGLAHPGSEERASTGIPRLDAMLGGKGFYRGSSILVSGSPGAGKTSVASQFIAAACARGERCLFLAYEESPGEIVRNMRSVGIDLRRWIDAGLLTLQATRPTSAGFESHLGRLHSIVDEHAPAVVVVDPVSAFNGPQDEVTALLARLIDFLKSRAITTLMTSLIRGQATELSGHGVSSVIDTWLTIRTIESNGERNRLIDIVKARGIGNSNQVRELLISDEGLDLSDVYVGPEGIAVGSERQARESARELRELERAQALDRSRRELARRRAAVKAQITALEAELKFEGEEVDAAVAAGQAAERMDASARQAQRCSRRADPALRTARVPAGSKDGAA
jgi:circadian clock protein KaiC